MLILSLAALREAAAQRPDTSAQETFFVPTDAALLGAFFLGSAAISVFDPRIAQYFQQPSKQNDHAMRNVANVFTHVQETTLTLAGLATYGIARLAHSRNVADIAFHTTESIAAASVTCQVIRGPLGRARPNETGFTEQYEFHWFNGFTNFKYRSYPSIHTSSSFAVASSLVAETYERSPRDVWIVAPIAYVLASGPGYARLYLGEHWASDVFMGAFFGTFYGYRIVTYSHAHPNNKMDRFFLGHRQRSGISMTPDRSGLTMSYRAEF